MLIHCIAVAGTGMGALAGLFKALGHDVRGSDVAFDPPIGPELDRWGVRRLVGFDPAHLDPPPDLVVVGNVCRKDNVEAVAARERGLRITTMAHALADFALAGTSPLVVAGTHGKTTTSAIAAFLLQEAGLRPGYFIGGVPLDLPSSFRAVDEPVRKLPLAGKAPSVRRVPFVVEGDEYDTAFFEKTPKFWHYRPDVAIITSIEHDHIDIYPTVASYEDAFRGFVARLPGDGLCVAAANHRQVVDIVRASSAPVTFFALEGDDTFGISPEWVAAPGRVAAGIQEFDLYAGGVSCGRVQMRLPGAHNVRNALAAIAAAAEGYGARIDALVPALAKFGGVRRRQELVAEVRGVRIYDDFAHHPTAVEETLLALRRKHPSGRLWAIFEPRSATACRAIHQDAYAHAFGAADRVIFAPLGRTNIPEGERLDLTRLVNDIGKSGRVAEALPSVAAIVALVVREAQADDTVAVLSNGAFGGIHRLLADALAR